MSSLFRPMSPRPPVYLSPMAALPGDLVLEIVNFLSSRSDMLNLSMASSCMYTRAIPAIYSSVALFDAPQCVRTLSMLARRGDIARHVRKLVVRPNSVSGSAEQQRESATAVCVALKQVAAKLDALNTFVWDGDEMPACDGVWLYLRLLCPQLKTIGTSIGSLPTGSHLFEFKDLKGFSLTFKGDAQTNGSLHGASRLWTMLIDSCPNLEELCLDGFSSWPTNEPFPLLQARWPELRKLTLGDIVVDLDAIHGVNSPNDHAPHPFTDFLAAHPKLASLRTSRYSLSPTGLRALDDHALPALTEFSGTLEQLQHLRRHHPALTAVGFHEPMLLRAVTPLAVSAVLQGLPNLTTLRLSFVLQSMYESGGLLRALAGCCPRLARLELVCAHKPSFPAEAFAKAVAHLPRLRVLALSTVRFPGDPALAASAVLLARLNPRLEVFTLAHLPAHAAVPPLPAFSAFSSFASFAAAFSSFSSFTAFAAAPCGDAGTYTIVPDAHGLPVYLCAVERRARWWAAAWPVGVLLGMCGGPGPAAVRRYRVDLRPGYMRRARRQASWAVGAAGIGAGAAGAATGKGKGGEAGEGEWARGWREWVGELVGLLGEGSAAGEELRMVVFLGVLCVLSLWGFAFVEAGHRVG